jgi:hypothetical protein
VLSVSLLADRPGDNAGTRSRQFARGARSNGTYCGLPNETLPSGRSETWNGWGESLRCRGGESSNGVGVVGSPWGDDFTREESADGIG